MTILILYYTWEINKKNDKHLIRKCVESFYTIEGIFINGQFLILSTL